MSVISAPISTKLVSQACSAGNLNIHVVVKKGLLKVIEAIEENNPILNQKDTYSDTPLHLAIKEKRVDIVAALLAKGADPTLKDLEGQTALHRAVLANDEEMVQVISATMKEKGLNTDALNSNGDSSLHIAIRKKSKLLIINTLINNGASLGLPDSGGEPAIHRAVFMGRADLVDYLAKRMENLDITDLCGYTPLHVAMVVDQLDIMHILARQNASLTVPFPAGLDSDETPPLEHARERNKPLQIKLLEGGAASLPPEKKSPGGTVRLVRVASQVTSTWLKLGSSISNLWAPSPPLLSASATVI